MYDMFDAGRDVKEDSMHHLLLKDDMVKWGVVKGEKVRKERAHLLANLGWVDFDLCCSTLCLVLSIVGACRWA